MVATARHTRLLVASTLVFCAHAVLPPTSPIGEGHTARAPPDLLLAFEPAEHHGAQQPRRVAFENRRRAGALPEQGPGTFRAHVDGGLA